MHASSGESYWFCNHQRTAFAKPAFDAGSRGRPAVDIQLDREGRTYIDDVVFPCHFQRIQRITGVNVADRVVPRLIELLDLPPQTPTTRHAGHLRRNVTARPDGSAIVWDAAALLAAATSD